WSPVEFGGVQWRTITRCNSAISLYGAPWGCMLPCSVVRELPGTPEPISMPRPRAPKLENPTSRRKLPVRKKPYFVAISPGIFLGYCRNEGHCKWSVRVVRGRAEWTDRFATTDDLEPANGRDVLNYWHAVDQARALARGTGDAPDNKPMTVEGALDAYERDL